MDNRDRPLAAGPMLAGVAYDRAALHRTDDAWLADAWTRARVLAVSPGSATPVTPDGRSIAYLGSDDVDAAAPRRFLGLVDDQPYFAVTTAGPDRAEGPDAGPVWLTLRDLGTWLDDLDAGLFTAAIGLEQWHEKHTHCPRCGSVTEEAQAGWVRRCPVDDSMHFPRTDPAVIMLIHDGSERVLLGRGPAWNPGRFSTLAGFVEPGESLEAAVAREVFEEVGVHVRDVRYVASQPWPFPSSLMVGFTAELDGDPSIELDPVEMAEAYWFTRDEVAAAVGRTDTLGSSDAAAEAAPAEARLQAVSPKLSISRYLIDRWLARA